MHGKVDPAALLIAVLAVGISPLLSAGAWDAMNTVVAAVVGAVLIAFTWPRKKKFQNGSGEIPQLDEWVIFAQAVVYGLVIAIGSAWIVQLRWNVPSCERYHPVVADCIEADNISRHATWWALGIGGGAAIILYFWMKARIKRLISSPPPPRAPPPPSTSNALVLLLIAIISLFSQRRTSTNQPPNRRQEEEHHITNRGSVSH
jgi:hypothetical protein